MELFFARLSEPSTWAGFSAILVGVAESVPNESIAMTLRGIAAIAGGIAVVMKEGAKS